MCCYVHYLGKCALFFLQDNAPSNTIATGSKITVYKMVNRRESGLEHVQRGLNWLKHALSVSSGFSAARPLARCTKSTRNLETML